MSKPPSYYPSLDVVSDYEGHLGDYLKGPVKGSAAEPAPTPLEINGAPAVELSHEYVIRKKSKSNAED